MKKLSFVFVILFVLVGAFSMDASALCKTWPDCGNTLSPLPFIPLSSDVHLGAVYRSNQFWDVDLGRCIESSHLPISVYLLAYTRMPLAGIRASGELT